MHTVEYEGYFIHCYTNKSKCHVQLDTYREFKDQRAAKIAIAKHIKKLADHAAAQAAQRIA